MQGNFVTVILYIVRPALNSQTKDNSSLHNLYAHIPFVQESGFYGTNNSINFLIKMPVFIILQPNRRFKFLFHKLLYIIL